MQKLLLLGSTSFSRQKLLKNANISFMVTGHQADEAACDWGLSFQKLLESIAVDKMEHVIIPEGKHDEVLFVLTADTLNMDEEGGVHGKPVDKADAFDKLRKLKRGKAGTAFCLDKKVNKQGVWHTQEREVTFIEASYVFDMPDEWIEKYLESFDRYTQVSGGISIEGYGAQFLKTVDGSYSTILGLPMFELREALEKMRFYKI